MGILGVDPLLKLEYYVFLVLDYVAFEVSPEGELILA